MKTCPYCGEKHNNQEWSDYCDIDCVIRDRMKYDKACKLLDEQEMEKRRSKLKYI